jgi:hypothetical protein
MPILTSQRGGFAPVGGLPAGQMGPLPGPTEMGFGPDQEAIAKTQAEASKFPYELKQQRFNQVFPWLQGMLGGTLGGIKGPFTAGGAQIGTPPPISAGPVWDPQQIQQNVNASRATTDASTQAQMRQASQSAAGRGMGANGPLVQALQGQLQNQNLATNVGNEQSTRWNAALGNAGQLLKGQQAQEGQFAARQQEDIERRRPVLGFAGQLLSALGGLV